MGKNMAKLHDLAVKVGSYTNSNGDTKSKWKNIGSIIETKDGGKVILLDRTFNPAGVPVEEGRDSIMISMFAPKDKEAAPQAAPTTQHQQQKQNGYQTQAGDKAGGFDDMADDIPF